MTNDRRSKLHRIPNKAFTLIELLAAIATLAILAARLPFALAKAKTQGIRL